MKAQDKLVANMTEIVSGINLCFRRRLMLPTLVLIYTTVDALAYLNLPPLRDSSTRQDFIDWVDMYLLPGSSLACDAVDLYGARCGILHSLTADSNMSRGRKARPLLYSWGQSSVKLLQRQINAEYRDLPAAERPIAVHIDELLESLKLGMRKFEDEVHTDQIKWLHVMTKANSFFTTIPQSA